MMKTRTAAKTKQHTLSILIADDNPNARAGLRALLQSFRAVLQIHRIEEAHDGEQAVEIAKIEMQNLILMDANMPRMNGIVATEKIKALQPGTAIIVVSINPSFRKPAFAAGADAFLLKGFTPTQLQQTILKVTKDK